ncbi:MAG: ABC transporter substrate binding [Actinobacteria bacterium]|nr:MAG: ABC transporter substrate binding [Actinomycetota bacterium]MDO8948902.1 transporter substrate-binding domain-containing protein [Actinomycetota bacterium]
MHLRRVVALVLSAAVLLSVGGCGAKKQATLTPKIAPPVIAAEGVLRAGVDLSYPPFAGEAGGKKVGIDVDVAAAVAERLGLRLEVVDIKSADVPAALKAKTIDIALGAVPIADAVLADVTVAGSYFTDGPGLFSMVASGAPAPTIKQDGLAKLRVGAQQGSAVFWALESAYGEGFVAASPAVRGAFEALSAGSLDVVAADAVVGAYLARDFPGVAFVGQYGSAEPLGVLVAKDDSALESAIRGVLDVLSSEGVLDAIRTKWVGALPVLEAEASGDTSTTP